MSKITFTPAQKTLTRAEWVEQAIKAVQDAVTSRDYWPDPVRVHEVSGIRDSLNAVTIEVEGVGQWRVEDWKSTSVDELASVVRRREHPLLSR